VHILEEKQMKKISFYLPTEILGICDRNLERANVRSRNQFLVKAVKFYEGYLNKEDITEVVTPAFETVIDARLDLTEHRISQTIFKLAVEMAATMNVLAGAFELDDEKVRRMKHRVIQEVKELNGWINLKDIIRYQNGEA
jgi:metal-responsive CopG/Arc/MetJ family transcriptional regulator